VINQRRNSVSKKLCRKVKRKKWRVEVCLIDQSRESDDTFCDEFGDARVFGGWGGGGL
jgi:hypothetical protein